HHSPQYSGPPLLACFTCAPHNVFRKTPPSRSARHGFDVQSAASGDEALTLAQRRNFDVAIFDMMMPGMSGMELLKRFKVDYPDCEVLFLTVQGSLETEVEAMKLGA